MVTARVRDLAVTNTSHTEYLRTEYLHIEPATHLPSAKLG